MSSTLLFSVMRCAARYAVLTRRGTPEAPGKVCGVVCVRWTSSSARFGFDSTGRPVTWESFGIWDNRIEEPIILPSSIKYGKPIPQVTLSKVGSSSVIGLRKQNEDRLRVARIHDNLLYFAVFDGHGGPHAADYCYTFMEKHIRDALEEEEDLEKVLTKAFLDTDSTLRTHLSYFQSGDTSTASFLTSGTTATVAVLRDGVELVVGSVGDSRALLCRDGQAHKLTSDHTPDRKDEMKRIRQSGGFITWNSVGQAYVNGKLAMTRSIGDFHLRSSGVIAEPETRRLTVKHVSDSFLALTTDGINFLLSDQEICDVIIHCHDPTEAAEVLTQQALQYGSEDNTSAIVVSLGAWGRQMSPVPLYSVSRNFVSTGRWA